MAKKLVELQSKKATPLVRLPNDTASVLPRFGLPMDLLAIMFQLDKCCVFQIPFNQAQKLRVLQQSPPVVRSLSSQEIHSEESPNKMAQPLLP